MNHAQRIDRRSSLERVFDRILDLLYPRLCPGCQDPLIHREQPQLCDSCVGRLHPLDPPLCPVCGEKYQGDPPVDHPCVNCHDRQLAFEFARAGYHAHDLVREFILALKYRRELHLLPLLIHLLGRVASDPLIRAEKDWIVVPVPLHPRRQRKRSFNQAAELGRGLARNHGWRYLEALRRVRLGTPQAELDREARLRNLRDAFALREEEKTAEILRNATILLVDDVLTTGSTAHECAKILKDFAGVAKVGVVTVARAGTPPQG